METVGSCWRDAPEKKGEWDGEHRRRGAWEGGGRRLTQPLPSPCSPFPVHLPNLVIPEDASLLSSAEPGWAGGLGEACTGCGRRSGVRAGAPTPEPFPSPCAAQSLLPSTGKGPPGPPWTIITPSRFPTLSPAVPEGHMHIPDWTDPGLGGKTLLDLWPPEDTPRKPRQEARGQSPYVTQGAHTLWPPCGPVPANPPSDGPRSSMAVPGECSVEFQNPADASCPEGAHGRKRA